MAITSLSLSYYFLGVSIIALTFLFYFKTLVIRTSKENESRDKIIGNMKDPDAWRSRNNKMSYVSLFWTIISLAAFIYLKFFMASRLIPIIYLIVYLVAVALSLILFGIGRKKASS